MFSRKLSTRRPSKRRQRRQATSRHLAQGIETLEQRWTPAQFGIPWNDSTHLTVSFAPDGTTAAGQPSGLFATLDAQMPRATWQSAILRAAQTWANVANLNFGVRPDQGLPIGTAGPSQGDPRFGDIRIAGLPMANTELAVSSPPSNGLTGTFSGDIFINTAATFTAHSLYAIALHEFGHSLGLGHSTSPTSVMFAHLNNLQSLSPADVTSIRNLYGNRSIDLNEVQKNNNTLADATTIRETAVSGTYDGSTPMIAYGDLHNSTDVDFFEVKTLLGYSGPMSIRVQTSGISMVAPKVTVLDRDGFVLGTRQSISKTGDTLTIKLASVVPDQQYFIKVESAPTGAPRIGRFGVAVTYDGRLQSWPISIDSVLRGKYETVPAEKLGELFRNPSAFLFENDLHTNDTLATASNLRVGVGNPNPRDLAVDAALSDSTDVDYYRVKTPTTGNSWVVTATVRTNGANGVLPRLQLIDSNNVTLNARIIANGNKTMSIEVDGIAPNRALYVRVASPQGRAGNYSLDVRFSSVQTQLDTFIGGTVTSSAAPLNGKLYIARTQLMDFVLEAAAPGGSVTMQITDSTGQVVQQLTVGPGNTASSVSQILKPGEYSVRFTSTARTSFTLRGSRITDPIGPILDDGTLDPQYTTDNSDIYLFPDEIVSTLPYLWILI